MAEKVYAKEPVTPEELAHYGSHVIQYSGEYSFCAGCDSCMIMCGLSHEGTAGHGNGRIQVDHGTRSLVNHILSCQQCHDHPCYNACPRKDAAMCLDPDTSIAYVNEENCIGCGLCARACKFQPSRIVLRKNKDRKKWKAMKCDLCRGNPEGPQCIKWCPVRCIGLSDDSTFVDSLATPVQSAD